MPRPIVGLSAVAGVLVSLGASLVGAQQVKVTVNAVPNTISAGTCARIWADVKDDQNRQLTFENGGPILPFSSGLNATNRDRSSKGFSPFIGTCPPYVAAMRDLTRKSRSMLAIQRLLVGIQ